MYSTTPDARKTLLAVASQPVYTETNGIALRQVALLPLLRRGWRVMLASPDPGVSVDRLSVDDHRELPRIRPWNPSPGRREREEQRAAASRIRAMLRPNAMLLWPGAEHVAFSERYDARIISDRMDAMTLSALRDVRQAGRRLQPHQVTTLGSFARYERQVLRASDATTVVGDDDARVLRWLAWGRKVHVVRNGVEVGPPVRLPSTLGHPVVVFTGVLSFPPNVMSILGFVRSTWPAVRARHPDARLVIAGRNPVPEVRGLAGSAGVEVHANVPSIAEVIRQSWICIAPMRSGTGVKNKVLEAWAEGRPVVLTRMAANGLAHSVANDGLVAETPDEMAGIICRLIESPTERASLGRILQEHVLLHHQWDSSAVQLSSLLSATS